MPAPEGNSPSSTLPSIPAQTDTEPEPGTKLSTGTIVGISTVGIVGAAIIVVIIFLFYERYKNRQLNRQSGARDFPQYCVELQDQTPKPGPPDGELASQKPLPSNGNVVGGLDGRTPATSYYKARQNTPDEIGSENVFMAGPAFFSRKPIKSKTPPTHQAP
ncbi:hypothetical protein K469DRAFT_759736 [Zopfia rhizophila CBS 207.26]|uniref:Uncharacterized protein n=1 Tax=Zopfia rhizophila CBS 207.26 TaxID=1314779 RepID=A0A6A6EHU7_9PEZI|nr:hypothetical protein K469DRAFT_759736 [Zopfia rhizophila CBS 207.26]